jgi:membrane protease YdiL (CAAX protease family)
MKRLKPPIYALTKIIKRYIKRMDEFMKKITNSLKMYFGLILVSGICAFIYVLLPGGAYLPRQNMPFPKPLLALINGLTVLFFYGGIGFLGIILSHKNGFKEIINDEIKNYKNILKIITAGIGTGIIFITVDVLLNKIFGIPLYIHPPFPASLFASINAGIGEELMFRLFFVSFWVWIFSKIIKDEKGRNILFWVVGTFSALIFAIGHLPAVIMLYNYKTIYEITLPYWIMIIGLNGLVSIAALYNFKKYGFIGAVLIHTFTDIIWHVLWGIIQ